MTMRGNWRRVIPTLLSLGLAGLLGGVTQAQEKPYFSDVAEELGLTDGPAKECCFADVNGDGYWDVFLEKRRLYLNKKGKAFKPAESGMEYPTVRIVPLTKDGKPDLAKAKEREFVPHHVYFADLDNDGDPDAVCGVHASWEHFDGRGWKTVEGCDHGQRTTVYLNDGKGRFEKAAPSNFTAPEAFAPAMALAILDYDNDGRLDLYEGCEYRRYGVLYGCGVDRLWKGDGKGGFTDVTEASGLMTVPQPGQANSSRPTYGVTHGDLNNDGWQDLLQLAYGRQWNLMWQNDGDGTFTEVGMQNGFAGDDITHGRYPEAVNRAPERAFRSNGNTFDCAVADYDADGDLDCFLGEIQHAWAGEASDPPSLLINQGEEGDWTFQRKPVTEFLPKRPFRDPNNYNYADLHAGWLDFDNDGWLDLLIASGDYPDGQFLRLYRQKPDHSFEEVTEAAGFDWEGCGGLSLGDFDRDGDVDVLVGRSFMRLNQAHRDRFMAGLKVNVVGLFRNELANRNGNHWLNVRLVGKGEGKANRSGLGARITVTAGDLTQTRELRCGSGLGGHQDPPEACFGLGRAKKAERLVVRWPDAERSEQVFRNVPADRFATITQGRSKPELARPGR